MGTEQQARRQRRSWWSCPHESWVSDHGGIQAVGASLKWVETRGHLVFTWWGVMDSWRWGKTLHTDNSPVRGERQRLHQSQLWPDAAEVQTSFSKELFLKLTPSLKVVILGASWSPLFVRQGGSLGLNQNRVNESTRGPETTCEILILALERPLEVNFLN